MNNLTFAEGKLMENSQITEAGYRAFMQDGMCHKGICTIDECSNCQRKIKALKNI